MTAPWENNKLAPAEYRAARSRLLDEAHVAGTEGNHGLEAALIRAVGALEAQYAEQCRRTLEREADE